MPVDLTGLRVRFARRDRLRFGGVVQPSNGAALLRSERMGSRWSFALETPPMALEAAAPFEPSGRSWETDLQIAENEGGIIRVPQPWFAIGAPGAPTVASATARGRFVPVAGGTPHYGYRKGQWVTVFDASGRRYADKLRSEVIANASGAATLELLNLLRAPLAAGAAVHVGAPTAEGEILDLRPGAIGTDGLVSFAFTLMEAK